MDTVSSTSGFSQKLLDNHNVAPGAAQLRVPLVDPDFAKADREGGWSFRLTSLRQGYGGPPKRYARRRKAEATSI
jgi:hypothetical protein